MLEPIKIGNVKIDVPVALAPLAGVTDFVFRSICREHGAGLVCTEMVSAKAVVYKNKNTAALIRTDQNEHPSAMQLFGSDPKSISESCHMLKDASFDIIDFNMGCPVPKVVKNGEGSALMRDLSSAKAALTALVSSAEKPVTVKIRAGFNSANINAVDVAMLAEDCGVSAITVHGRTREQYYSGKADLDIIKKVKSAVNIPVFGNGDITDGKSAQRMLDETGCDGIMIGRAAMGNPWIFEEIIEYLKTGKDVEKPAANEIISTLLMHAKAITEVNGEYMGIRQMRSHAAWYLKGFRNAAKLRGKINSIETYDELEKLCLSDAVL